MNVTKFSLKKDGQKKLGDFFRVREFACKNGDDVVLVDLALAALLNDIRKEIGKPVIINSAYRPYAYNFAVGGSSNSKHVYGMAADIRVNGVTPMELAVVAEKLLNNSGGIGLYGTFVHVDVREDRSRWKNDGTKNIKCDGFYKETMATKVKNRFGLADETIRYLLAYKYSDDLLRKMVESP